MAICSCVNWYLMMSFLLLPLLNMTPELLFELLLAFETMLLRATAECVMHCSALGEILKSRHFKSKTC